MFRKNVWLFGVSVALLSGGLNLGCSNSKVASGPCKDPQCQACAVASSTTQPVAEAPAAQDDPFHITKPTAPVEGVPPAQETPSPEAIVTNKRICPSCGTPNAVNAAVCVKCGHKFE